MHRRGPGVRAGDSSSKLNGSVMIAPDGDGSVVLHVASGTYLRLDPSATEILELVEDGGAESAATILARRHGIDHNEAGRHVASVIEAVRAPRSPRKLQGRRPGLKGCLTVASEWARLPVKSKLMVVAVVGMTISLEIALHLVSIATISRWAGAPLGRADTDEAGLPEAEMSQFGEGEQLLLASVEWTLARWIYDRTCLRKALLSGFALRRRRPALRIGLTNGGEDLAHAWLSFDSFTLGALTTDTPVFHPLPSRVADASGGPS